MYLLVYERISNGSGYNQLLRTSYSILLVRNWEVIMENCVLHIGKQWSLFGLRLINFTMNWERISEHFKVRQGTDIGL